MNYMMSSVTKTAMIQWKTLKRDGSLTVCFGSGCGDIHDILQNLRFTPESSHCTRRLFLKPSLKKLLNTHNSPSVFEMFLYSFGRQHAVTSTAGRIDLSAFY